VIEACEYRRHFLELSPEIAVVLGIEPDHFDCFPTIDDAIDSYCEFVESVDSGGTALVNIDTAATRTMLAEADTPARVETMSTCGEAADWMVRDVRQQGKYLLCTAIFRGQEEERISVPLLGTHHAGNVLAAYAAARTAGVHLDPILRGLTQFAGLSRRLERFPSWRGVSRFDDYAHHPTAVEAVLRTLRGEMRFHRSDRRLVCAFQPHQISRTEQLLAQFSAALSLADVVWVLPVYAAREGGLDRAVALSKQLAAGVDPPCQAQFLPSLDHALLTMETSLRPGDMFVTLGAGDIDCLQYDIARRFP
jgi:UDP-N-acetylmuramate--alanine ligase